jgi:hypothetical protein
MNILNSNPESGSQTIGKDLPSGLQINSPRLPLRFERNRSIGTLAILRTAD